MAEVRARLTARTASAFTLIEGRFAGSPPRLDNQVELTNN